MPDTFVKIASVTVGGTGPTSIDFTSIPSTYTDLVIQYSIRTNAGTIYASGNFQFNGDTGNNYNWRYIRGDGSSAGSSSGSSQANIYGGEQNGGGSTSNTFSNGSIYIPNYAGSTQKSVSIDQVQENNGTTAYAHLVAGLWTNTSAITSIKILSTQNIQQYSTATLYGIKNS